jgi:hypothetical protein
LLPNSPKPLGLPFTHPSGNPKSNKKRNHDRKNEHRKFGMFWIPGWSSVAGSHWWEGFFFWVSIGGLILLGVAEIASHRYAQRKDELAAIEQQEVQDQHDKDMAALHLKAASLEKEAAAANERTAEIEKYTAWRRLSQEQSDAILNEIRPIQKRVVLAYIGNDPECLFMAAQLEHIFKYAEWKVQLQSRIYSRELLWNFWIPDTDHNEVAKTLKRALEKAGLIVDAGQVRDADLLTAFQSPADWPPDQPGDALILVGSKKPPPPLGEIARPK